MSYATRWLFNTFCLLQQCHWVYTLCIILCFGWCTIHRLFYYDFGLQISVLPRLVPFLSSFFWLWWLINCCLQICVYTRFCISKGDKRVIAMLERHKPVEATIMLLGVRPYSECPFQSGSSSFLFYLLVVFPFIVYFYSYVGLGWVCVISFAGRLILINQTGVQVELLL